MISQVAVVFVHVLAIGLGAERGERCTNQWGEKATCTNIYSCKATMDAVDVANGAKLYATGVVCGYDTEPLVCCRTVADFNETSVSKLVPSEGTTEPSSNINSSVDLNISTNTSTFNESLQVLELLNGNVSPADANSVTQIWNIFTSESSGMTEFTTASLVQRVGSNNQLTTSTSKFADEVIYTSPPILNTSDKTSVVAPKVTQIPDALPLESNDTYVVPDSSTLPDDTCGCDETDETSNIIPETPQSSPVDTPSTPPTFNKFTELPITTELTTEVHINKVLPDRKMCGFQVKRNRMADAPIASIDEFPWVALLRYQDKYGNDTGFRCVGTLINYRYVITSAHCVVTDTELLHLKSVRLGEWSISNPTDCVSESGGEVCPDEVVDVGIEKKIPHPNYNPKSGSDIALIRMERDVHFTDYVRPICLPVEHLEIPFERTTLKTSGWGASKSGSVLDIKSKIHLPVLSKEKCLRKVSRFMPVFEGQFCVDVTVRNGICKTDSGGPLMVLDKENKPQWYLEGVIPEGFYCDQRSSLGVYTRVTEYISWIISTLEQGSA